MVPTGSKLLIGGAAVAIIAAVVYGTAQGGSLGTVGLIFAAAALTLLAGINVFTRDADVSAMDTAALTESAAARRTPPGTVWPIAAAVGGVLVVVGIATYPVVLIFGIIALLGAAVEWMIEAWSDRASGDRAYNADVRARIAHPLEFPLLALLGVGILIYSFSRIMLWLSKSSGPALFAIIAALLLAVGFLLAFRPTIRGGAIGVVCSVAALGLVAGGASAALDGQRTIEHHETTSALAEDGKCDESVKTEADEDASQSVAAKASILAEINLDRQGKLTARPAGVHGAQTSLTVTRATTTNVMFHNDNGEPRRLVLDLGTRPEVDESTGDTIPDTSVPNQRCTQIVDSGGSQLLTFSIPVSSAAAEATGQQPYAFVVPGVETANLPVNVP
jgi:hypothetical protein